MKLHFIHIFKYDRNYNTFYFIPFYVGYGLRYVMDTVQNTKCSLNEKDIL